MTYYTAIVKGTRADVLGACLKRGFGVQGSVSIIGETHNSCVVRFDGDADAILPHLSNWYHERQSLAVDHGYPAGTCMLFTRHDKP